MATIQLIRNATLKISLNTSVFLIDPMLGKKGSFESYGNVAKNPITELPIPVAEITNNVDAVLVTHLHKDHLDDAAKTIIEKSIPVFCQPTNANPIKEAGFLNVAEIETSMSFNDIEIHRTSGKHGRGKIEELMGKVSGLVLKAKNEPSIYIVGDSVFNNDIKKAIDTYQPEIIITNSGGAFIPGYEENLILMDEEETISLANYASTSKIIAVHLEALDHCTVNRASLQRAALKAKLGEHRFFIPLNGDCLHF